MALCKVCWIRTVPVLTVPQQAVRIGEVGAKRNIAGFIVELSFDGGDLSLVGELAAVGEQEFNGLVVCRMVVFLFGHVVEVEGFGHIEINPHDAVVRKGGENVPFFDKGTKLLVLAMNDSVEGSADGAEIQVSFSQFRLGFGFGEFGAEQSDFLDRNHFLLVKHLGIVQLDLSELCFRLGGVVFGFVEDGHDLEENIPLLHRLSLLEIHFFQIAPFQGADLDVPPGMYLANELLCGDYIFDFGTCHHDRAVFFRAAALRLACGKRAATGKRAPVSINRCWSASWT
ncbi:MAG: hypothetical protein KatS3mg105_1167 [Gemmatales bacterium]|nr:MAG: hypothetical protein KatS3mg105_1167 [Gemmatales bacterium]